MLDVKKIITTAISILDVFAGVTPTTGDDKLLSLLRVLEASPLLLDWLQGQIGSVPASARASLYIDQDEAQSMITKESINIFRRKFPEPTTPEGTEPLNISTIISIITMLMRYYPQILELIRLLGKPAETPTT